jgi:hypothetical protein
MILTFQIFLSALRRSSEEYEMDRFDISGYKHDRDR